jgi:hypothetical protein
MAKNTEGFAGCRPSKKGPKSQMTEGVDDEGTWSRESQMSIAQEGLLVKFRLHKAEEARRAAAAASGESDGAHDGASGQRGSNEEWCELFGWAETQFLEKRADGTYDKKSMPQAMRCHNTFENFVKNTVPEDHAAYQRLETMRLTGEMTGPWEEALLVAVITWITSPECHSKTLQSGVHVRSNPPIRSVMPRLRAMHRFLVAPDTFAWAPLPNPQPYPREGSVWGTLVNDENTFRPYRMLRRRAHVIVHVIVCWGPLGSLAPSPTR